jgi:hypothetical protein
MRRTERSQGDIELTVGEADVSCGGEQLMQQGSPLLGSYDTVEWNLVGPSRMRYAPTANINAYSRVVDRELAMAAACASTLR